MLLNNTNFCVLPRIALCDRKIDPDSALPRKSILGVYSGILGARPNQGRENFGFLPQIDTIAITVNDTVKI